MSYISTDVSTAQTLSGPNAHPYSPTLSSPLARSKNLKQSVASAGPASPRILGDVEPATPPPRSAKRPHPGSPDMPPPPPKSPATANRLREREKEKEAEASGTPAKSPLLSISSPQKTADSVT
jgi:hypothetical protein